VAATRPAAAARLRRSLTAGPSKPIPLDQLRAVLDELADAGMLHRRRRAGLGYPIWSAVHGLAVLTGQGPLRDLPDATR